MVNVACLVVGDNNRRELRGFCISLVLRAKAGRWWWMVVVVDCDENSSMVERRLARELGN